MRVYEASISYKVVANVDFKKVETPTKVVEYMRGAFDEYPMQETFWVVLLNRKNHAIARQMITLGTLTGTLVSAREVLRPAILAGAASIVVSHNHPSGDPSPSSADLQVTRQLKDACQTMDIPLTDHIVIGDVAADPSSKGYYSFREAGLI